MEKKLSLYEYLEEELPSYYSPMGIQVYLNPDSTLIVCCYYPGFRQLPDISLELFQEVDSLTHLISLLQLKQPEELLALTADDLLNFYDRGLINIVCMLEKTDQMLYFKKNKKGLWAKDMDEKIHQVKTHVEHPADFIAYTLQYYKDNSLEITRN
jgi:hypothetical protein